MGPELELELPGVGGSNSGSGNRHRRCSGVLRGVVCSRVLSVGVNSSFSGLGKFLLLILPDLVGQEVVLSFPSLLNALQPRRARVYQSCNPLSASVVMPSTWAIILNGPAARTAGGEAMFL